MAVPAGGRVPVTARRQAMIELAEVDEAAARIRPWTIRTPVLSSSQLDNLLGLRLMVKAEHRQRTGSFKLRGALNHLLALDGTGRRAGVVAASSGNHGIAVAEAALVTEMTAVLVVPADVPPVKADAIRQRGARLVTFDRFTTDRDVVTAALALREGRSTVPSSDDCAVMIGCGTVALELLEQAGELDALVVPVGGGGLAAGCASVAAGLRPTLPVYGVEPAGADDTALSIRQGTRCTIAAPTTIADGLRHRCPGELTFPINQRLLHDVLLVSDETIVEAMRLLWDHFGDRVEPSGACALAGVIAHADRFRGGRVAVIASGGNVDSAHFAEVTAP